jgi:sodium/potassium-transporting ATPase subunit alpha
MLVSTKDDWSSQGRRVLLLARKTISNSSIPTGLSSSAMEALMINQAKSGLTLVGLVGIVDPPRSEIPEVIRTLRGAGIRIFMVRLAGLTYLSQSYILTLDLTR